METCCAGLADWRHPRAQRGEGKIHQSKSPYFSDDPGNGGWFSELVKCYDADSNLAHIPDAVTDIQAISVDDMAATGFTGVERMEIQFGEVVVILGVGPVGLMGVAVAALRGAGRIIAVGSRPNTMELATQYGATDLVDYKKGDVYDQIMALTDGVQADSVLIASFRPLHRNVIGTSSRGRIRQPRPRWKRMDRRQLRTPAVTDGRAESQDDPFDRSDASHRCPVTSCST